MRTRLTLVLLAWLALAPSFMVSSAPPTDAAPATPPAATIPTGLHLNEVLFRPTPGEPAFVEMLNTGAGPAPLDGLSLVNERDETFSLAEFSVPLAAGAILLILCDGVSGGENSLLHAPVDFLTPDGGRVELHGPGDVPLDTIAWGAGQPDAVNLGRGGLSAAPRELMPGTTIGRAPENAARGAHAWTTFGPAEATPGTPNPQPGVTVLLPLPGAILDTPVADLSWYPVPGAAAYRVQLATAADTGFAAPLLDTTVSHPALTTDPLPNGRYQWRVQAIGGAGPPAAFSPAQALDVEVAAAQGAAGLRAVPGRIAQPAATELLLVPLLAQRKDSRMLLVDRGVAENGAHAWDVVHPDTDMSDPADNMNCVLAVAAMINALSGGELSQDRIGFEIRGAGTPGAAGDLNWMRGLQIDEVDRALAFALGVSPGRIDVAAADRDERDYFWQWVIDEINAGRPLAVLIPDHAVVVSGYAVVDGERRLLLNDPIGGRFTAVRLDDFRPLHYYLTPVRVSPRSDEPGVAADGDGVTDFDETERFGTDPANPDSDVDQVKDKQDILASVFDPANGYANFGIGRPDFDGDSTEMEEDRDSDDFGGNSGMGGCPDGLEDANRDGKQNGGETSNFDASDDRCLHARQVHDMTVHTVYGPDADGIRVETNFGGQIVLEAWLTDVGGGRLEGTATYGGELTEVAARQAPICGAQEWQHTQTYAAPELLVSGTRQGDHVELTFEGEIQWSDEGIVAGKGCATDSVATSMTYDAATLIPPIAGDLVNGRYEDEQVFPMMSPFEGATTQTLIEQKGRDETGAPVG